MRAGQRTCYGYDETTGLQVSVVTNADGSCSGLAQYFSYSDRGELERTWGQTSYPVEYTYDEFGRRTTIQTYRSGNTEWEGEGWPETPPGDPDITTFHYGDTELSRSVTEKEYADGNSVLYTYEHDGKLATRTWARTPGSEELVTQYSYDSNTRELSGVEYLLGSNPDPDTPSVGFTYDRLGRQKTITDAVGTRTFTYRDNPATFDADLQLASEGIVAGQNGLYSLAMNRKYEFVGTDQVYGRAAGLFIGPDDDPQNAVYSATYHYDAKGRGI